MIYLDNSATTKICPQATEKIKECFEKFGNPSSLHSAGVLAENLREEARNALFKALGVKPSSGDKIVFTSGGTEANNLAVFGTANAKKTNIGKKFITTDSEHHCILTPFEVLAKSGYKTDFLSTKQGLIDLDEVREKVDKDTVFLSVMLVNNETGAVNNIKEIFKAAKQINPNIITHTDCVQGFCKIPFSPLKVGADLVTVSSHKIHGPKGCGALYINSAIVKAKKIVPIIYGGGQEDGFRSGTENMPGICGMGEACSVQMSNLTENIEKITALRNYAEEKLSEIAILNIPKTAERAPHILNITLPGLKSETILHFLSADGIFVSSGSACSSNSAHKPSHVLTSFGLSDEYADSSIRISFCSENTKEDIDALFNSLVKAKERLITK